MSLYIAPILLAVAVLLLAGVLWRSIRVEGGISRLRMQLMELQTEVEQLDTRITREVKTRAGLSRAENAMEEKTLTEQAHAQLALPSNSVPISGRPKRQYRRI